MGEVNGCEGVEGKMFGLDHRIDTDPRQFLWKPKDDITPWELAQCLTMFAAAFSGNLPGRFYDRLTKQEQRHWEMTS